MVGEEKVGNRGREVGWERGRMMSGGVVGYEVEVMEIW